MRGHCGLILLAGLAAGCASAPSAELPQPTPHRSMSQVLAEAPDSDWVLADPADLVFMELDSGTVVFHLAEAFAPAHAANIRTLVSEGYFDGLEVIRVQENYVVQWGDGAEEGSAAVRSLGSAAPNLEGEYYRSADGLVITPLGDADAYAPQVGFAHGYPVGSDGEHAWLTHCYGMVGAGRGMEADSGNGSSLYVVIGHAPRHLDRNVTLVGRVLEGMEHLTTLPRGTGPLGFYEDPAQRLPIRRVRLGSQIAPEHRREFELMRTDSRSFEDLIEARRWRREDWFIDPVGHVGLCNVPLPVREKV